MTFYAARCSVSYTPSGATEGVMLCRAGQDVFFALPEYEWELQTDSRDFCAAAWGQDVPIGNARARLTLSLIYEAPTLGQALIAMREREFLLAGRREGTLLVEEGYHQGVPVLRTAWHAVVTDLSPRSQLMAEDAISNPDHAVESLRGLANARLAVTFTLTHPEPSHPFTLPEEPGDREADDEP